MNRSYDQGLGLLMKYNMLFFVCTGFFLFRKNFPREDTAKTAAEAAVFRRGAIRIRTGE